MSARSWLRPAPAFIRISASREIAQSGPDRAKPRVPPNGLARIAPRRPSFLDGCDLNDAIQLLTLHSYPHSLDTSHIHPEIEASCHRAPVVVIPLKGSSEVLASQKHEPGSLEFFTEIGRQYRWARTS